MSNLLIDATRRARLIARRNELKRIREARAAIEACLANFDQVEFTQDTQEVVPMN